MAVTLAPVLQRRDVVAGLCPGRGRDAVLSPAGALASPVTGRCPAQPRRCGFAVVLTTAMSHRRGQATSTVGAPVAGVRAGP
jgi:hypothetical protein